MAAMSSRPQCVKDLQLTNLGRVTFARCLAIIIQLMALPLYGAKSLLETTQTYQFDSWEQT